MRVHNLKRMAWAVLAVGVLTAGARAQSMGVGIQATLILASNDRAPLDSRLDFIEYKLRRVFGFEYYRHCGEARATLQLPAEITLSIGRGFELRVKAGDAGGGGVRANVQWIRGSETLLTTTVKMGRGNPVVLGGVPADNGTYIVTLLVEH